MLVNSTSSTSSNIATDPTAADGTSRVPVQTLGQDDFLKLLTAQMSAQDPMNPQSDTQFIAQMAQFSALEQAKSTASDISKLQTDQQLTQANSLIGRAVTVQVSGDQTAQGTVSAVQIEAGTPQLIINGQNFDLSQVLTISSPSLDTTGTSNLKTYARITQLGR